MSLDKLKEIKEKIEVELEKFFDNKINEVNDEISKEVLEFLKDYTLRGGKRIRPAMVVYGYACFKEINEEIIKVSMVMELLQSYFLIHDDIIDKDDLRRGKDSMHIMYEKKYNDKHFSMSMAICAGDLAASLANEILLDSKFKNKSEALKIMNKMIEKVIHGQMLDVAYAKRKFNELNEEDILNVYRMKSASYTVEGPLLIGSALANVKNKNLLDYGIVLGKGFQIRDDINGTFGNEEKTGKPSDSDLKEGKKTLLLIKTLENCDDEEKKFILENLNDDLSIENLDKIRELIRIYGLEYCEKLSSKFVEEAKERIKNCDFREEGKKFLLEITEFVAKTHH